MHGDEPISPELALVSPELAEAARETLPDRPWEAFVRTVAATPRRGRRRWAAFGAARFLGATFGVLALAWGIAAVAFAMFVHGSHAAPPAQAPQQAQHVVWHAAPAVVPHRSAPATKPAAVRPKVRRVAPARAVRRAHVAAARPKRHWRGLVRHPWKPVVKGAHPVRRHYARTHRVAPVISVDSGLFYAGSYGQLLVSDDGRTILWFDLHACGVAGRVGPIAVTPGANWFAARAMVQGRRIVIAGALMGPHLIRGSLVAEHCFVPLWKGWNP